MVRFASIVPTAREATPWIFNNDQNCPFFFGYDEWERFLIENRFLSIIRSPELYPIGLPFYKHGLISQFSVLIRLFSVPNYCDVYNNWTSVIIYDHQRHFRPIYFCHRPHPFVLPNHENGFEFGHRIMKTYIQEISLSLIQKYTKLFDYSQRNHLEDNVTKSLKENCFHIHINVDV